MSEVKLRYSKQRETIYDILCKDCSHPTVDTIYMNVRKVIPDISLGTVYRNLNLLADQKRIIRLEVGDNAVHFDSRIEPHFHMVCEECGEIHDLFLDEKFLVPLIDKVQHIGDDHITGAEILFHGTCHQCRINKS